VVCLEDAALDAWVVSVRKTWCLFVLVVLQNTLNGRSLMEIFYFLFCCFGGVKLIKKI